MSSAFKARTLVAEDEEFTLNLRKEVLENANIQVESVNGVAEAIELVGVFDSLTMIMGLNFGLAGPGGGRFIAG